MPNEYSPPYRAHKHSGQWYVVDDQGRREVECDCRHDAETTAKQMNEDASRVAGRKGVTLRLLFPSFEGSVHDAENQ